MRFEYQHPISFGPKTGAHLTKTQQLSAKQLWSFGRRLHHCTMGTTCLGIPTPAPSKSACCRALLPNLGEQSRLRTCEAHQFQLDWLWPVIVSKSCPFRLTRWLLQNVHCHSKRPHTHTQTHRQTYNHVCACILKYYVYAQARVCEARFSTALPMRNMVPPKR